MHPGLQMYTQKYFFLIIAEFTLVFAGLKVFPGCIVVFYLILWPKFNVNVTFKVFETFVCA